MLEQPQAQPRDLLECGTPSHGAPACLTEQEACTLLREAALHSKKGNWTEVASTLDALRFALCLDVSPIGNPLVERVINSELSAGGVTLLATLVVNGAPETLVKQAIAWGANPHGKVSAKAAGESDRDLTLLHLALGNNRLELALILLEAGVRADQKSSRGYESLTYYCAMRQHGCRNEELLESVLQKLFEAGASFEARGPSGVTNLEHLSRVCSNRVIGTCLSLQATRAKEQNFSSFTQEEVQKWALALIVDSSTESDRALTSLSELCSYAQGDGLSQQEFAAEISQLIWMTLAEYTRAPNAGGGKARDFLVLLQQLTKHPALFPREIVRSAINTPWSDEDWQPSLLWSCIQLVSPYRTFPEALVECALSLGADPNAEAKVGVAPIDELEWVTPLDAALQHLDLNVAETLISYGAKASLMRKPSLLQNAFVLQYDDTSRYSPVLREVVGVEEYTIHTAAHYPRVCAEYYGTDKVQEVVIESFRKLTPLGQFKAAARYPDLTYLQKFLPDGPSPLVQDLIDQIDSLMVRTHRTTQSVFQGLSHTEAFNKMVQMGRLAEARLLLILQCPVPSLYLGRRSLSEVPLAELSGIRKQLIDDCEYLYRKLSNNRNPADTVEELLASRVSEASFSATRVTSLIRSVLTVDANLRDARSLVSVLEAMEAHAEGHDPEEPDDRELAKLLPRLLFRYPLTVFSKVLSFIEFQVNSAGKKTALKNLAEAFAVLHHPEATEALRDISQNRTASDAKSKIDILTAAISSFTYLSGHGREVTGSAINAWRSIANTTHGHRRYRFDTKRQYGVTDSGTARVDLKSFFEAFGGRRLPQITEDHPFHSAYLFHGRRYLRAGEKETAAVRALDDTCVVVRYRAGEVFFDPSIGYIFTRNSSLVFGRDLVPSPAYFVPVWGVMRDAGKPLLWSDSKTQTGVHIIPQRSAADLLREIQNLTPEILTEAAYPIMEPLLYPRAKGNFFFSPEAPRDLSPEGLFTEPGIDLIAKLCQKRAHFEREYRRFGFDTDVQTAWKHDESGNDVLIGAFHSPGFGKRLKRMRAQFEEARYEAMLAGKAFTPPHALECHNPDTLPISPYARLVVTEEVLSLLERLARDGWPETSTNQSELEEEGVYGLIERALRNQAELIVVAHEERQ